MNSKWSNARKEEFASLWNAGTKREEIGETFGLAPRSVHAAARRFGLRARVTAEWTPERIEILTRLWIEGRTCRVIAAVLGELTLKQVSEAAKRFGLPSRASQSWNDAKEEKLRQLLLDGATCSEAADILGMTPNQIIGKSWRLGMPRPGNSPAPHIIEARASANRSRNRAAYRRLTPEQRAVSLIRKRENDSARHALKRQLAATKPRATAGTPKTSPVYRNQLPGRRNLTKTQLMAMLAQAAQNTAAMEVT
jgi:hypothetical protein